MVNQYKDRITILDDQEIEELYGLPRFAHEERTYYFALTPDERSVADSHRTLANRVLFILQAGYFKAKTMFFTFEFQEVEDDVHHILQQHFPRDRGLRLAQPIAKQSRTAQQQRILALYGYQACDGPERKRLTAKAEQLVQISAKPIYLFQALIHYLATRQIVAPGYSFLQDLVSQALATERQRLTAILEHALNPTAKTALNNLHRDRDGLYAITTLKHEPMDFSVKEMRREMARGKTLTPLYRQATEILPELGISNDSVAYYAALVDYYTVQKLQQMAAGQVYLYLLCFILQRYQKLNDNLVNALLFHVRKVVDAAKAAAKEKCLGYQLENTESIRQLSRILRLFLDESIADEVDFGEVKRRAFAILARDKFQRVSQYLSDQALDDGVFEWEFIAAFAPTFKQHLRPLLMQLSLAGQWTDDALLEAIAFLKVSFKKGKSLTEYRFEQIPKAFVPAGMKTYLYEEDEHGHKRIDPDKYEFLVYRLLRNQIEAGNIYVSDSLHFRSFEEDLIPQQDWNDNKAQILKEIDVPALATPAGELLQALETELESQYEAVNRRIQSGENAYIKQTKRRGQVFWSLPYSSNKDQVNNPFFDHLPQIGIGQLLQFVDSRCQCLDAFTHILNRYVKTPLDRQAIVACLVACGTNVGLGKMGKISDLDYQALYTAANSFLRLETVREANDRVSNAIARLPIFRHYHIDDAIHSSSDGQKLETQFHTIRSRHSPKYFGLKKGIAQYTMVTSHVPVNARFFGANEHESHYVFDVLYSNTTDIRSTIHSTDTHGTNEVNFAILSLFGYQFAPRYRDIRSKTETLYGFKHPSKYDETFLLKPASKVNSRLIVKEWGHCQHIMASLALKVTSQSIIIGKLSAYARRNRTKKALWELDNIYRSLYLLKYVDLVSLRRNVQRALNRGESYHKLRRAVAYAYSGRLRVKTDLEQQIWSECSRLLANCVIFYNACTLSELLARRERQGDQRQTDHLKRVSPVAWKHVNFFGEYNFRETAPDIDLAQIVDRLEAYDGAQAAGTSSPRRETAQVPPLPSF